MDIRALYSFLKVIEKRNFSEASEELNMTQPTLSQQISKLEEELGVRLINRTTRSFAITDAGREFAFYAGKITTLFEEANDSLVKYRNMKTHQLRIGVVPTLGKIHLTKYVLSFGDKNPGLELELVEDFSENLYKALEKNKVDVIIANRIPFAGKHQVSIDSFSLFQGRMVVVCGQDHRFAKEKSVTLEECAEEPVIRLSSHSSVFILIDRAFKKLRLKQKVICSCETTSNMISLVDANYGISFLSDRIAKNYATDKTCIVKITPKIHADMVVCARSDRKDEETVSKFISHMLDVVKKPGETADDEHQ